MRVILTGSRGFIGKRLIDRLRGLGHSVVELIGDVRRADTHPEGPFDAVLHLASLITHRGNYGIDELWSVNVTGTERVLSSYPEAHVVLASTIDVTRENLSDYARTKSAAEACVSRRIRHCIVRLPSVFGPGQRQESKLIPRLLRHFVLNEEHPPILNNEIRPYLFVEGAVDAMCAGLERSGIHTVAGTSVSNHELVRFVECAACGGTLGDLTQAQQEMIYQLSLCAESLRVGATKSQLE